VRQPRPWHGLLLALQAFSADATEFREQLVTFDHAISGAPLVLRLPEGGEPALVAVGAADGRGRFSIVRLGGGRDPVSRALPSEAVFYDVGDPLGEGFDRLCLIEGMRLSCYDAAEDRFEVLAEVTSLYRGTRVDAPTHMDFIRDLDGDGGDELLIPDFTGWHVLRHASGGEFQAQLASIAPQMRVAAMSVDFTPRSPVTGDVNGDGRSDLVFIRDTELIAVPGVAEGGYAATLITFPIAAPITAEAVLASLEDGDGTVDQSDLEVERVAALEDFDGDGVLDLMTDASISRGVFDRRDEYRLYRGRQEAGSVQFPARADTAIASGGVQFDPLFVDVDGDGRLDTISMSARVGLGRIVAALLSGRMTTELAIYRMRAGGQYPGEPDHRARLKVEFDLGTGYYSYPAVGFGDVDGDGRTDLVLQHDADELAIHAGLAGQPGFAQNADYVELPLPRNGRLLAVEDLDADGRADLLVRYSKADGAGLERVLRVLLSQVAAE
jgi:hypothetical protein